MMNAENKNCLVTWEMEKMLNEQERVKDKRSKQMI